MKTILLTFMVSIIYLTGLNAQWKVVNEGHGPYSIDFVSKDVGFMSTANALLKTTDGGVTWNSYPWNNHNPSWSYYFPYGSFNFVNDSTGYITKFLEGDGSISLYRTTDSGQNWEKVCEKTELRILWASEDVIIIGEWSILSKSTDGGNSWMDITPQAMGFPVSISFINQNTGVIAGDQYNPGGGYLQKTFDGGKTWHSRELSNYGELYEIELINETTGHFLTSAKTKNSRYLICLSQDAFGTWDEIGSSPYPIHTCHFFDKDVCIAVMEDSSSCNIMKSTDRGQTWTKSDHISLPFEPGVEDWNYQFLSTKENTVYLIITNRREGKSPASLVLKSINQGDTWSVANFSYPFYDVCFTDEHEGYAVGGYTDVYGGDYCFGNILATNDRGKTWEFRENMYDVVSYCNFANDHDGYLHVGGPCEWPPVYNDWQLYKSSDGGTSWFEYPQIPEEGSVFHYLTEQTVFKISEGFLYLSEDGGETWDQLLNCVGDFYFLNSITSNEGHRFWGIAGFEHLISFNDKGDWEIVDPGTDESFKKVFFVNDSMGWIAGPLSDQESVYGPFLFRTQNGGASWELLPQPPCFINDLVFRDPWHGWAVGYDDLQNGIIIETTNGGDSWSVPVPSLSAPLRSIRLKGDIAWAVGENGLILTNDPDYASLPQPENTSPGNRILLQNYPNPFSTSTTFQYQLPESGAVEMTLYDFTGKKIATLANETQQPGKHFVDWNMYAYPAGIYLCKLAFKGRTEGIKIIKFD